jgi:hypothetical protein
MRPRPLAAAAALIGAAAALAVALGGPAAAAVPGPKEPIEHVGISGAHFFTRSGTPSCFGAAGSVGAGFPVPAGAMVVGATLYTIDSSPTAHVFGELVRHNFTSGGTFRLGSAASTGGTGTVEIGVDPGYVLGPDEAVNLIITKPAGACFKGGEVHFVRKPAAPPAAAREGAPAPVAGFGPDAAPAG